MDNLKDIIEYIDSRLDENPYEGSWIDDLGNREYVDVGYAYEWWQYMRAELLRKFGKEEPNER